MGWQGGWEQEEGLTVGVVGGVKEEGFTELLIVVDV